MSNPSKKSGSSKKAESARSSKADSARTKKSQTPSGPVPTPRRSSHEPPRFEKLPSTEEEYLAVDDPAAEALDAAVKQTPWWALSLGFHGLVLAALPLIIFSHHLVSGPESSIVLIRPKPRAVQIDLGPDRPKGLVDTPPLPNSDEGAVVDKPVFDPTAVLGDHDESPDDMDLHTRKGDSLDFTGWIPGDSGGIGRKNGPPGMHDSIGVGDKSGSGGRFGDRNGGGRINMVRRCTGGQTGSEDAVKAGLRWLARHQSPDGHWDCAGFDGCCKKGGHCGGPGFHEFDTGVTGLALLAFLGAGHTPGQHQRIGDPVSGETFDYGEVTKKGLAWLVSHQATDGAIGPTSGEMMYNHAIATLSLCEAYGLSNAVVYRAPAQKAINFLHTAQNYNLGWRYTPKSGDNDTSVTGWCVMALKSAQISGLEVAQTSFEGAKAWIDRVTDTKTGETGYDKLGSGEIFAPGHNEGWSHHPTTTAVGALSRIFIEKKRSPILEKSTKVLMSDLPKWDPKAARNPIDSYYWYYGQLVMFQLEAPSGANWGTWNKAMLGALLPTQHARSEGCIEGSWDSNVDRWGYAGGRVTTTALNVLTLETYYRYRAVFGK